MEGKMKLTSKSQLIGSFFLLIIMLFPMTAFAKSTSISCGQTISASISTVGEQDSYSYSASAGDVVDIRVISTSTTLHPQAQLKDSHGNLITTATGNPAIIDTTLSTRGT
jgi:hypothetical protein